MKKTLLIVLTLSLVGFIIGCYSAPLTTEGKLVRIVTTEQNNCCCDFLELVSASETVGVTQAESVMNKVRNKVAKIGGNAMMISHAGGAGATHTGAYIMVEALKCDFTKIKSYKEKNK